jgi:NAD(P)H-dependent FMN reductase
VKFSAVMAMTVLLSACGVETAGTAATGAAIKKQELEEGRKTQERAQQKIDEAVEQMRQRAQRSEPDAR